MVVSADPKKVYVDNPNDTSRHTIKTKCPRDKGQQYCWYRCYTKGGREARDVDVRQLVTAVEAMGAGEIMLNSIDLDGTNSGFDFELVNHIKSHVKIPVIASSGARNSSHFKNVFCKTSTDTALGAGMVSNPYLLYRNAVLKETLFPSSGIYYWTSQGILGEGRVTDTTLRTRPSKSFMSR